ncbi:UNVERIFIED_CONTAM: succinyl-CoA synthetase beta subunit [Streptomyces graminofaciens]
MDLYEHQARELFGEYDIPVPEAETAQTAAQAREAAERLGGRVVVKAQVKTGGRGKAGGVKLAADAAAAEVTARQILGMDIKGHTVRTVMLAQPVDIEEEFYVSYVLDRAAGAFLAIASAEGGMDIEEVAATRPEAVARIPVPPAEGVTADKAAEIAAAAGLPQETAPVLQALWQVLVREDALLVEVNPLVRTTAGDILALDGKVTLDDNARFRQARWGNDDATLHEDPAGGGGRRQGPQLRQARRHRRRHRQRRRPGHVHPRRRRRLRREARELPRHRRRRLRGGDGRRAVRHPLRP